LKPKIYAHPQILSPSLPSHIPKKKILSLKSPFNSTANNVQIENGKKENQKYMQYILKLVENKKFDGSICSGYRI
jgi:hypothetical protein